MARGSFWHFGSGQSGKNIACHAQLTDIVKSAIKTGGEADRIADCRACHGHAELLDSKQPEAMRSIREHKEAEAEVDEPDHAPAPKPKEAMARAIAMCHSAGLPEDELALRIGSRG
ncbi:hypothetical protein [Sedimentitalea sp.]|uniref:hypothetical protein n=1 Tax=Sedimentitalea sp. TaxID=2048915 RepID=UPI003299618D